MTNNVTCFHRLSDMEMALTPSNKNKKTQKD